MELQIFTEQLRLFANLAAGRNMAWYPLLVEMFPSDFLINSLWNPQFESLKGVFFLLLFNIYIDRRPMEPIHIPQLVCFISDHNQGQHLRFDRRIRAKLNDSPDFQKQVVLALVPALAINLAEQVKTFYTSIKQTVQSRLFDCKFKKLVLVPDIPRTIVDTVEFFYKLLQLNVLETFEETHRYSEMLQACFNLFDYNQQLPALYIMLQELKERESLGVKPIQRRVHKKLKGLRKRLLRTRELVDEEGTQSLIVGNYYSLKNEIHNKLDRSTFCPTHYHQQVQNVALDIFHKMLDLRHQFLLDNYTEWIRSVADRFVDKPYTEAEEQRCFAACAKGIPQIIPPVVQTSLTGGPENIKFARFVQPKIKEIYDLPFLLVNPPSEVPQSELHRYQNIVPSLIVCIITTDEEESSIKLMSFFLRLFSQRREFINNIKKTFVASKSEDAIRYEEILGYCEGLDKMLEDIQVVQYYDRLGVETSRWWPTEPI